MWHVAGRAGLWAGEAVAETKAEGVCGCGGQAALGNLGDRRQDRGSLGVGCQVASSISPQVSSKEGESGHYCPDGTEREEGFCVSCLDGQGRGVILKFQPKKAARVT